ncbi:MAG: phage portal protein [Lachnospiraceae bacterium]|nr:phage portal protein [Lachnospiraceae bacterium]
MAFFKFKIKDWLENLISTADISEKTLEEKFRQAYVKELALYTAVGLIADILSGCERKIFKNGEPVQDGTWYVWNVSANPNQTAAQLIAQWVIDLYYKSDGALIVPLGNNLYNASSFSIDEYPVVGNVYRGICIDSYQINRTFRAMDVFYLKQYNPQIRGLLNGIFDTYAELLEYSKSAYGKSSGEKYVLQLGAFQSGTQEERDAYLERIRKNLVSFASASSAAYPATKDQTLTKLSSGGSSSASTDYTNLRKDVYDVVASALHLPVGLLDGNITSVDQVLNQALTMAIDPLARKMDGELTRKTFERDQILYDGCRVKIDTSAIKHIDMLDMAEKVDKLISCGVASIDEVRERCNMPALHEDWSERHFITKNYEGIDGSQNLLEGGE